MLRKKGPVFIIDLSWTPPNQILWCDPNLRAQSLPSLRTQCPERFQNIYKFDVRCNDYINIYGILTGVGRQAGQISFLLQGNVPFTLTMAISFSKRPRPDGCPLFSPRIELWAVSQRKSSWRKTFSEKFKFHFERIIVQYLCCLQANFVRIQRTWSVGTDMVGSARHQDILRVRFSGS